MARQRARGWQSGLIIAACVWCVACSASTPTAPHGEGNGTPANSATPTQASTAGAPQPTTTATATRVPTRLPTATGTPTQAPVVQATPGPANRDFIQRAIARTNGYRQQHGCAPLTENTQLDQAALGHSQDMATHNYFAHDSPSGQTPWDRIHAMGYMFSAAAENIAAGYATPEAVIDAFYNEQPPNDGHRRNLLNCALHEVGIGYFALGSSTYHTYWTQDFGTRP